MRRRTEWDKRLYAGRKERSFADAKQLHGHRYARTWGLHRAAEQCLLAAAGLRLAAPSRVAAPHGASEQRIDSIPALAFPSELSLRMQNPTLRKTWGSSTVWPANAGFFFASRYQDFLCSTSLTCCRPLSGSVSMSRQYVWVAPSR